jgi:hypothetical protein
VAEELRDILNFSAREECDHSARPQRADRPVVKLADELHVLAAPDERRTGGTRSLDRHRILYAKRLARLAGSADPRPQPRPAHAWAEEAASVAGPLGG